MVLAGKGAHGVGTGGGTVGRSNGRAVKLGNLEQVLAGPQLALELAEFFDGLIDSSNLDAFGQSLPRCGLGLLIEFLSHTISLISRGRAPQAGRTASLHSYLPCTQHEQNGTRRYAHDNVVSYSPMR